jgi:very-short-patch-repair endonuclease
LEAQGFTVLRFTNAEVFTNVIGVLARIVRAVEETSP